MFYVKHGIIKDKKTRGKKRLLDEPEQAQEREEGGVAGEQK
jgi:hypothetical protein